MLPFKASFVPLFPRREGGLVHFFRLPLLTVNFVYPLSSSFIQPWTCNPPPSPFCAIFRVLMPRCSISRHPLSWSSAMQSHVPFFLPLDYASLFSRIPIMILLCNLLRGQPGQEKRLPPLSFQRILPFLLFFQARVII